MVLQSGAARRFKDETGKTYGKLSVLRLDDVRNHQPYFICQCGCGKEVSVRGANLRSGNTKTCGCSRRSAIRRGKMAMRTFGQVLVLGKTDPTSPKTRWVTLCKHCPRMAGCYTERRLRSGEVFCKCLRPTHNSWRKMIERCTKKNHAQFGDYGGRGITICQRWRTSFSAFVSDVGRRPDGKTLDRINNDRGYYRENCRWATKEQQAANRRKRSVS